MSPEQIEHVCYTAAIEPTRSSPAKFGLYSVDNGRGISIAQVVSKK